MIESPKFEWHNALKFGCLGGLIAKSLDPALLENLCGLVPLNLNG